jgi:predicted regulator of Ras-like GTPase activity (Roadblock/LC7/MglB family)
VSRHTQAPAASHAPADTASEEIPETPPLESAGEIEPWRAAAPSAAAPAEEPTLSLSEEDVVIAVSEPTPAVTAPEARPPRSVLPAEDPARAFDDVLDAGPVLGALLLDARGLVLTGSIKGAASADDVGAILGAAVAEAVRTTEYLELGAWRGMLMECASAMVHVRPIADQGVVLLAVQPNAPTGWVLRTAATLADRAARFLEVPA